MTSQTDLYFVAAVNAVENGRPLTPRLRAVLQSTTPGPLPLGASLSGFVGDDRKSLAEFALLTHDRAETLKVHVTDWLRGVKANPPADDQERILQRVLDLMGKPSDATREAGDLGLSADWGHVAEALRRKWQPVRKAA